MNELIEKRQENSKRFRLDSKTRQLQVSMGAIHYKDDYTSNEKWKDIDLIWEGNRITKAPYELTVEGKKLTIRNKKSSEVSTIELMEIGGNAIDPILAFKKSKGLAKISNIALDTDLEIVAGYNGVKFTRVLKSDKAPLEAKFKVVGNFIVRAQDAEDELPVETTLKDGILSETLKPDRPVKYPIRIDPTWQVGASTDDCHRVLGNDTWSLTYTRLAAGYNNVGTEQYGGGMRFTNITIPNAEPILDGTYLIFRASLSHANGVANTRISADDVDDAATFSTSGDFDTRWAARTTARVDWDAVAAWTAGSDYNSPEIKTVIQEIIDRGGWASGQDIVIFWEDFEDRSVPATNQAIRYAVSYDSSTTTCPQLVINYLVPSAGRGWAQK